MKRHHPSTEFEVYSPKEILFHEPSLADSYKYVLQYPNNFFVCKLREGKIVRVVDALYTREEAIQVQKGLMSSFKSGDLTSYPDEEDSLDT